jgi:hypothetical protein
MYGTAYVQTGSCTKEANVFICQYKDQKKLMNMPEAKKNWGDKDADVIQKLD